MTNTETGIMIDTARNNHRHVAERWSIRRGTLTETWRNDDRHVAEQWPTRGGTMTDTCRNNDRHRAERWPTRGGTMTNTTRNTISHIFSHYEGPWCYLHFCMHFCTKFFNASVSLRLITSRHTVAGSFFRRHRSSSRIWSKRSYFWVGSSTTWLNI